MNDYIERIQQDFSCPGIVVGLVSRDETLVRTVGERELGTGRLMEANTLQQCASVSKAFAAMAIAILVDEGKCAWSDKLTKFIPSFKLADEYVTREFNLRDMLSHRGGLPLGAADLLLWPNSHGRTMEDVIKSLCHFPVVGFRDSYNYNNSLYLLAGEVITVASGQHWEAFINERILKKIGMDSSYAVTYSAVQAGETNIAIPHTTPRIELNDNVQDAFRVLLPIGAEMQQSEGLRIGPAGSLAVTVQDMLSWIKLLLARGEGLVSPAQFSELFRIHNGLCPPKRDPPYQPSMSGYCLGWIIFDYRGLTVWTHAGGISGAECRIVIVPKLELGYFVAINRMLEEALSCLNYYTLDHFLAGKKLSDYGSDEEMPHRSYYLAKVESRYRDRQNELRALYEARDKDSAKAVKLPETLLTGVYEDAWFGTMEVTLNGERLEAIFEKSVLAGRLVHWTGTTYHMQADPRYDADALITFKYTLEEGKEAAVTGLAMKRFDSAVDFSFDYEHTNFLKRTQH